MLTDMTKFTINPSVVYSGNTCYVTIAAFIVISQGCRTFRRRISGRFVDGFPDVS